MTVSATAVSVAATATLVSGSESDGNRQQSVLVKVPTGGATVFLGGADVTTAAGFPLAGGESATFDFGGGDALYGIVASGTQAVNVLRAGV